jgi:hypothetical protein
MARTQVKPNFRHFNKYDFVKAFVAIVPISDPEMKEKKEMEAVIIADAIEETQAVIFENLATKRDLEELKSSNNRSLEELKSETKRDFEEMKSSTKKDLALLKYQLIGAIATLIVFLPPFIEIVKKLLSFD